MLSFLSATVTLSMSNLSNRLWVFGVDEETALADSSIGPYLSGLILDRGHTAGRDNRAGGIAKFPSNDHHILHVNSQHLLEKVQGKEFNEQ